jgi:pimeloyl-ACP methyl ester carboxylesterase
VAARRAAPDRVERLVAMSVGHPGARGARSPDREKAWYQLLFQFEGVAEELLSRDDWALFREWLRGDGDVDRYVADLVAPGRLTAGLNWYRRTSTPPASSSAARRSRRSRAPTLGLWSTATTTCSERRCCAPAEQVTAPWRYERIEGASHWMQLDATEQVNALLLDFLR